MTPGIHPRIVRISIIRNEPQPLSTTERGGKMIARRTLQNDMAIHIIDNPGQI